MDMLVKCTEWPAKSAISQTRGPILLKTIICKKIFCFETSKCKIYFAEFLDKLEVSLLHLAETKY